MSAPHRVLCECERMCVRVCVCAACVCDIDTSWIIFLSICNLRYWRGNTQKHPAGCETLKGFERSLSFWASHSKLKDIFGSLKFSGTELGELIPFLRLWLRFRTSDGGRFVQSCWSQFSTSDSDQRQVTHTPVAAAAGSDWNQEVASKPRGERFSCRPEPWRLCIEWLWLPTSFMPFSTVKLEDSSVTEVLVHISHYWYSVTLCHIFKTPITVVSKGLGPLKIQLLAYKSLTSLGPNYISDVFYQYEPWRTFKSAELSLQPLPTLGQHKTQRSYIYATHRWKNLSDDLRLGPNVTVFRSKQKTYMFTAAYKLLPFTVYLILIFNCLSLNSLWHSTPKPIHTN